MTPIDAICIADLHLSRSAPERDQAFEKAAEEIIGLRPQKLFILGDLFDFWLGGDGQNHCASASAIDTLKKLALHIDVHLLHGNRDFLLDEQWCAAIGMTLHRQDALCIESAFGNIILCHGDLLCELDQEYLRLRPTLRSQTWQAEVLAQSIDQRLSMAQAMRAQSVTSHNQYRAEWEVCEAAAQRICQQQNCASIIHGHTHRPARHKTQYGERWVLGDWSAQGGIGLCISQHAITHHCF